MPDTQHEAAGHPYRFGCCAAGADAEIHNPEAITPGDALTIALAALTYQRSSRMAQFAGKRNMLLKRRVEWDVRRLDAAIRRLRDMMPATDQSATTHDPATCGQCAEAEYTSPNTGGLAMRDPYRHR